MQEKNSPRFKCQRLISKLFSGPLAASRTIIKVTGGLPNSATIPHKSDFMISQKKTEQFLVFFLRKKSPKVVETFSAHSKKYCIF
jgi:hypothetical protein